MSFEGWFAEKIKEKGISLAEAVRKCNLYYPSIYASLFDKNKKRELRSSELIALCKFIEVNPMDYSDEESG